jgi:lipopolysaccharide heptosyltransferase II
VNILIAKLGATGDVVRTTPLLKRLGGHATWLTTSKNAELLTDLNHSLRCIAWEQRNAVLDAQYDLIINLEDTLEVAQFVHSLQSKQFFGAYLDSRNGLSYTDDSRQWFDLSLISTYGKQKADALKFQNRRSYQEILFEGLGFRFENETYLLPEPRETSLSGDVAIASEAGPVWPMKKWACYTQLKEELEEQGLTVNVLPKRASLLEHLCDVRNHRCLVSGDSLPMHFALGTATRCVTLFTCTSPWEIHDYGVQKKIVSPLLERFFYRRGYDERATTAIAVDEVLNAVSAQLDVSTVSGYTAV